MKFITLLLALLSAALPPPLRAASKAAPAGATMHGVAPQHILQIGGSQIQIDIRQDDSTRQTENILRWVRRAANAVTVYYGTFPVERARVIVIQNQGDGQEIHGTTWGDVDGVQGLSKMRLDGGITRSELDEDWTMTHEFVHMALSSLPDESHWLEEGLATYVEPIARAQAGQLSAEQVWQGMVQGMPYGEPLPGDRGLNQTHTWGRTYWGGALFCLIADVKIREATQNRKGLQDALRAIVAAGATIDTEWPLKRILSVGDEATGTTVLSELYNAWKDRPVSIDLNQLWIELGVRKGSRGIEFDSHAPLASIREAITKPSPRR
jgi:hypothetical protein